MHSSQSLSGDDMKSIRPRHSKQQQPKSKRLPDTTSQITRSVSLEQQQLKLSVFEALTNMSRTYTTAEIDAIAGLLMLRRCTPSPFRFSALSSKPSSVQTTSLSRRSASGSATKRATFTTRRRPRGKQKLNDEKRLVAHPTSQVPDSSSSTRIIPSSHPRPAGDQANITQYHHVESTYVSSTPSAISLPVLSQTLQAENPFDVQELYARPPRVVIKKGKFLSNASRSRHLTSTAHPTHPANILSSTNTSTQDTQHTSTTLHPQSPTTQQAPTPPNKPTLILQAPAASQHQPQPHQTPYSQPDGQGQAQTPLSQPKPRPSKSQQQSYKAPHHQRRPLLPKPPPVAAPIHKNTASTTTPTPERAITKPPAKKRKKYGTAYEVSRARQIQATGVPRLPGPCLSCARRQRQLDEVVAAVAASNTSHAPTAGVVAAAEGSAAEGGAAEKNITGPGPGIKKEKGSMGHFARPQRGDEFLPCMVLSNGIRGSGGDERKGNGHGPTPCARCKSIKMKCEG